MAALLAAPELLAAAVPGDLAVAERLRARWPAGLVAAATLQVELRARAAVKFSRAADMLFTRAGLEQASAEPVARHRADRLRAAGSRLADLCCGIGGDSAVLAPWLAVDADPVHARIAAHNAGVYGAAPTVVTADVRALRLAGLDGVYVDPARRDATGRGGYRPALDWCLAVATAVKAAPGIDRSLVPAGWEVEFVSVRRELKEATLWAPALAGAPARATLLPSGDTLVAGDAPPPPVADPGDWLVDPDPAVTRAGAVAELAVMLDAWRLDERIAFLCCADRPATRFGRVLRVEASLPFRDRELAAVLRRLDVGTVDVRRRGLAGDVDALRRRLRLSGRRRATVVMTRHRDRPWALVCTDPDPGPVPEPGPGPEDRAAASPAPAGPAGP